MGMLWGNTFIHTVTAACILFYNMQFN